ncbi:replication protein A 70 kDa DNA-binding subunit A-like [Forsythia ovata]|uniref:Replication protein A 70 kDa DNA-binding subunit A-like n=1 Tax=Forsythia ovata TaxID=205694 RepID=A0ABD1TMR3_9LAMI
MREAPMVDLKDIIEENIIELFCTFKATIIKVINKEQPWYENCKTCNERVYSRTEYDTTLCEKCENKKASFIRKLILKLVVSDGIDEAHVTLFDASDYLIGCTLSEYAEDMKKCETKEKCKYYKNLVTCQGKEYIFLVKTDKKTEPNRARKYIIAHEIKKYELLEVSNVQNEDDGPNDKKKLKIKKNEEEVKRLLGGKIKKKMEIAPCICNNGLILRHRVKERHSSYEVFFSRREVDKK